jgi:outer membrane receptor protein involved in Fe transport
MRFPGSHFLILFWILFSVSPVLAQTNSSGLVPKSNPGELIGIVSDSTTGQALEYVTLAVMSFPDSSIKGGGITDQNGQFQIQQLPTGKYILRVSFIGYTSWYSPSFTLTTQLPKHDLGRIKIRSSEKNLDVVEIAETRSDYSNSIDKKVYDVGQNITNAGGTATDILQNIPSVAVDMDGKVSLRGSENVMILIDGRPSGLTGGDRQAALRQIPASMIERVEIITNPSARYDAQGMAGIINIITKKGSALGYNGAATLSQGSNNKFNGSVNINNRTKKNNLFFNYNFRSEDRWSTREGEQHNFSSDTNYYFTTDGGGLSNDLVHNGRLGMDFYLGAYTSIILSGGLNFRRELQNDSIRYFFLDAERNTFNSSKRFTDELQRTVGGESAVDFKHTFPGTNRVLTASAGYTRNRRNENNTYKNNADAELPYQLNKATNIFSTIIGQIDYVHPFNDSFKVEAGIKYSFRGYDNAQIVSLFTPALQLYVSDPRFSDRFQFTENIYAAYLQTGIHRNRFDYQFGIRTEHTDLNGTSATTASDFRNRYIGLFPSASIRFTAKEGLEHQISYSRRINRPSNGQLNPFITISDSINLRSGNPFLQPEYINSAELNIVRTREQWSISATLYYRYTTELITMTRIFNPATGIALIRPINFSTSDNTGIETVTRIQFHKRRGNIMISLNGFRNTINGDNLEPGLQSAALNWSGRAIVNYRLTPLTNLQVSGFYSSPFVQPAGSFQMIGGIDIGLRQDLFRGRAQLTTNLTDILNTRAWDIRNTLAGYTTSFYRKRESLILTINFNWRFGKEEDNLQRRRTISSPQMEEGGGGF